MSIASATCECGHPWSAHQTPGSECVQVVGPGPLYCDCTEFVRANYHSDGECIDCQYEVPRGQLRCATCYYRVCGRALPAECTAQPLARDPGDEHSEPSSAEPQPPAVPALLAIIDAQHAAIVRVRERQAKAFAKPAEQRELWDACELANGAMPWR